MKILLILPLFVIIGCSTHQPPLSNQEITKQITFTGLVLVDGLQTEAAINDPKFKEANPMIHDKNDIIPVLGGVALLSWFAVRYSPKKNRAAIQNFFIGTRLFVVGNNYGIGIRF